ncbi:MAG: hypothetical protein V3U03_15840 [Myxococcota bacterium]
MGVSNRSFQAWRQRWFSSIPSEGEDLAEVIQPVVVIDDASVLQIPPILNVFGAGPFIGAVAAQYSTFEFHTRRTVLWLDLHASLDTYVWMDDSVLVSGAGGAFAQLQGVVGAASPVTQFEATTVTLGTRLLLYPASEMTELNIMQQPGQILHLQNNAINTAGTIQWLTFLEFPDDETLRTSLPRGNQ